LAHVQELIIDLLLPLLYSRTPCSMHFKMLLLLVVLGLLGAMLEGCGGDGGGTPGPDTTTPSPGPTVCAFDGTPPRVEVGWTEVGIGYKMCGGFDDVRCQREFPGYPRAITNLVSNVNTWFKAVTAAVSESSNLTTSIDGNLRSIPSSCQPNLVKFLHMFTVVSGLPVNHGRNSPWVWEFNITDNCGLHRLRPPWFASRSSGPPDYNPVACWMPDFFGCYNNSNYSPCCAIHYCTPEGQVTSV